MRHLSRSEEFEINSISRNAVLHQLTEHQVYIYFKYYLSSFYTTVFEWTHDVCFEFVNISVTQKDMFSFDGNTLLVKVNKNYHSLNTLIYEFGEWHSHQVEKARNGTNIETCFPYALEQLFNNIAPFSAVHINEYFVDGNFAYIKTVTSKPQSRRRRKTGYEIEREMVIEKMRNNKYRTKNKEFVEEFKKTIESKRAPKTIAIKIAYDDEIVRSYNSISSSYDFVTDPNTQMNYIKLFSTYKFKSGGLVIKSYSTPWVVKQTTSAAWVRYRIVEFANGEACDIKEEDLFFIINKFGGLEGVTTNPFKEDGVDVNSNAPDMLQTPSSRDEIFLTTSKDETEIIAPFAERYPWLDVELTKETDMAREYMVKNVLHDKLSKYNESEPAVFYFALYEGRWIATTVHNHKVKDLLYVYNVADYLAGEIDKMPG